MSAQIATNVEQLLNEAKGLAKELVSQRHTAPTADGRLLVAGEEYVLVRKTVLNRMDEIMGDGANVVLYQMGKMMGETEAQSLVASGKVRDEPLLRCLMRPFYYMSNGMGTVDILELNYDGNPNNFHVLYEDLRPVSGYLVMGYSAGWKSTMLGVGLEARAIAHGGSLRVLVAPASKLMGMLSEPRFAQPREAFQVTPLRLPQS